MGKGLSRELSFCTTFMTAPCLLIYIKLPVMRFLHESCDFLFASPDEKALLKSGLSKKATRKSPFEELKKHRRCTHIHLYTLNSQPSLPTTFSPALCPCRLGFIIKSWLKFSVDLYKRVKPLSYYQKKGGTFSLLIAVQKLN